MSSPILKDVREEDKEFISDYARDYIKIVREMEEHFEELKENGSGNEEVYISELDKKWNRLDRERGDLAAIIQEITSITPDDEDVGGKYIGDWVEDYVKARRRYNKITGKIRLS